MSLGCARPSLICIAVLATLALSRIFNSGASADDKFDIPAPADLGGLQRLTLWSTYYYAHRAQPVTQGIPLLSIGGNRLGVSLSSRDWCHAAMEGTVEVLTLPVQRSFNFDDIRGSSQVSCRPFFTGYPQIERSRFAELPADAPLGLGDTSKFRLVAFRSIAVDRRQPHFAMPDEANPSKVVIYVPRMRGIRLQMVDGTRREHDGYLFAADTGGAIRGTHIDFFLGATDRNPAPSVIGSDESATFAAHVINDAAVQEKLFKLHIRE